MCTEQLGLRLLSLFKVLFPFVVGGLGMVMAGFVLDKVQQWDFFVQVNS